MAHDTSCMMPRFIALLASIAPAAVVHAQEPATAPPRGSIVGHLVDQRGADAVHSGQAVVFLCDGKTGLPFSHKSHGALELADTHPLMFSHYWHAVTDESGDFHFDDVPPGVYRLVAQSWAGVAGMARSEPDREAPQPSSTLILHGVAEQVEVKPGEQTIASCRPPGDGVLTLLTDPEVPHNFIIVSSRRLLGEGSQGPWGWGSEFVAGALGMTRCEDAMLTIVGLPTGEQVHVSLFNYDNSIGLGGGAYKVGEPGPARIDVYAGWSNGKFEPPPRLEKLTAALEAADFHVESLLRVQRVSNETYLDSINEAWTRADEQIDVPGYGPARFIDVLAADGYRQARALRAKRQARAAKSE